MWWLAAPRRGQSETCRAQNGKAILLPFCWWQVATGSGSTCDCHTKENHCSGKVELITLLLPQAVLAAGFEYFQRRVN
jgi:hypothetical protein